MKNVMMMLVAAMISFTAVQAQDAHKGKQHRTPEEKAQMMTKRMTEELALTTDQAARINAINLKYAQQMTDLKAKHGDNRDAMKADMKNIRTQKQQEINSVLTKDQAAKLEQLKKERKEQHGKKKGHTKGKAQGKAKGHQLKERPAPAAR